MPVGNEITGIEILTTKTLPVVFSHFFPFFFFLFRPASLGFQENLTKKLLKIDQLSSYTDHQTKCPPEITTDADDV